MRRALLVFALVFAAGAVLSQGAEALLLFHFDKTRVSPAEAGEPRLTEVLRNGLVLWVAKPGPGKATVFYLPGNAGNLANRVRRFSRFLDHGLGLVALGYPGSSGSAGEVSADNIQRVAEALWPDIPALTGTAPVVLYGESLGTGVAVELAAYLPETGPHPAALVLEAPYGSIRDVGRVHYPRLAPLIDKLPEYWPSRDLIGGLDLPLLILHGDRDDLIPVAMGRALFAASPARDKRLYIVTGAGHTDVWQPGAQRVLFDSLARF